MIRKGERGKFSCLNNNDCKSSIFTLCLESLFYLLLIINSDFEGTLVNFVCLIFQIKITPAGDK